MKRPFRCQNPSKYMGNPTNIICRSSYELKYMTELDRDPNVIGWNSEELRIPYISPVDRRRHTYYPDFLVKKRTPNGIETFIVEIKPIYQTVRPQRGSKRQRTFINEVFRYGVNERKFEAARLYAASRGWTFQVLTEVELKIPYGR